MAILMKKQSLNILDKYGIQIIDDTSGKKSDSGLNVDRKPGRKVKVTVWGTGTPLREFMYSFDMAEACIYVMENVNVRDIIELNQPGNRPDYHPPHFINIGTGEEISIKELALRITRLTGFKGEIVFDVSKPDGTMRKTVDIGLTEETWIQT